MKRLAILGALLIFAISAPIVSATPPSGVTGVVLARGANQTSDTLTAAAGRDVVTQMITFAPGATTGWHTHPGEVVVVVVSGTLSLWRTPGTAEHATCTKRDVTAGQSWVAPGDGTEFDLARNETTSPVVVQVTYVDVPVGSTSLIQHQTTNPCPGTPDEFATSGVTGAILARGTMGPAIDIAVPAGPDFVIQEVVIAPGGQTGWHNHPGRVLVIVRSGTGTFVDGDCSVTTYAAGTAFLDTALHNFRNDGTTPLELVVTYTNVPVGGAFRIDQAAPACAAPAPTASALPNTASAEGEATTGGMALLVAAFTAIAILGSLALGWSRRTR